MNENQLARQKYAALMAQVEVLEETAVDLEKEIVAARDLPEQETSALEEELRDVQAKLAERRAELTRLSDGCGRPHP